METLFSLPLYAAEPGRTEFLHHPLGSKIAFYVLIFSSLGYCAWNFWKRIQTWKRGKPNNWKSEAISNIRTYILAQKKVRSSRPTSGAPMHLLIFYGFMALLLATTLLAMATYAPILGIPNWHTGTYYRVFELTFDLLGLLFVIGCGWAIVRRYSARPKGMGNDQRDAWALVLLFGLGLTGYLVEAGRIANSPSGNDHASPVGQALAPLFGAIGAGGYLTIWWIHAILVAGLFIALPHLKLRHLVFATATAASRPEWPMGQLQPISMEEVEQTGKIGVAETIEFTRWHIGSLDACMECGRCTEVCPANGVGKILDPKLIVQGIKSASGPILDQVSEEALWACTTCHACVEACPVLIRHTDLIVDVRRNLVAEGKLSGTGAVMLRQTTSTSHAWGAPSGSREDWMKDLEVPLARDRKTFDVLFWVGCAGATDPAAVKTTRAVAQLMKKAGVDFACLGNEEACTGDSARRIGDEFLFQEMAMRNVGVFGKYEFKRILTACPHCLNTLKNEYGQFEGNYEVLHHTQMLHQLVKSGKLAPIDADGLTYHDPCYLARVNDESDAPRGLLRRADMLKEPPHRAQKTLCCGAGGGRMWMEEPPEQRPGNRRAEELIVTGAKTVAVACPFCRIMLDASIKQVSPDEIRLVDMAELLHEANA